jgi:flavodoxin
MKKALIAYVSLTGNTEKMAQYIAEGLRISGSQVTVKKVSELKKVEDLEGYDGYLFGSPTYHRDMVDGMKTFLFLAKRAGLKGKLGAAFGSYTHSGDAPGIILDTMQHVFGMKVFKLSSFNLKEAVLETTDGIRACQDYGRVFGEDLGQ